MEVVRGDVAIRGLAVSRPWQVRLGDGRSLRVLVRREAAGDAQGDVVAVEVDGRRFLLEARRTADGAWSLLRDGVLTEVRVRREGARWVASHADGVLEGAVMDAGRASLGPGGGVGSDGTRVRAPMPGRVVEVMVAEGASVAKGDALVVVEAMKMENVLRADAPGVVSAVHAAAGATVEAGRALNTLAAAGD